MIPALVLASASPRRLELLRQIGIDPEVRPVDIDETPLPDEAPESYVHRLALEKARAAASNESRPVLGSDTAVILDGHILGKPENEEEGCSMLRNLSGRRHVVLTAVALVHAGRERSATVSSDVEFAELSDAQIRAYWASGEPIDKAGAYGIQGRAAAFIKNVHGSYSGVVGLPLHETAMLLREAGIRIEEMMGQRS